jgi:hypothetical protein
VRVKGLVRGAFQPFGKAMAPLGDMAWLRIGPDDAARAIDVVVNDYRTQGFSPVIVPALVYLAGVPVKKAVGSSLLIITLNALSGFVGYIGQVPIDWTLVGLFTGVAAVGALVGTRLNRHVSQVRIKQGFALLILILGGYLVVRSLVR